MKFLVLSVFSVFVLSCQHRDTKVTATVRSAPGEIATVDYQGLEEYINNHPSETLVVNFWATWCKPCIKELPAFEEVGKNYKDENLAVILVSLDFPEQIDKLREFIKKRALQSEVVFLNDGNANEWIPKVSEQWSGAIPATLIVSEKRRTFHEQSFTVSSLKDKITPHLNTEL